MSFRNNFEFEDDNVEGLRTLSYSIYENISTFDGKNKRVDDEDLNVDLNYIT